MARISKYREALKEFFIEGPTTKVLRKMFVYQDGKIIRKITAGSNKAGTQASIIFHKNKHESRRAVSPFIWIGREKVKMCQIVWAINGKELPKNSRLGFSNGNPLDCRIENLVQFHHLPQ